MKKIKNSLVVLLGIFALISLATLLVPSLTQGQGQGGGNQSPLNVNVVNTPLPVRDVENRAIEPFRASTAESGATLVTVPEGKLLVIELVTGAAFTSGTNSEDAIELFTPTFHSFFIAPSHKRVLGLSQSIAWYTHSVRFYVLPGEQLSVNFVGIGNVSVSGYYADAP
jgi:hypothetical protein